MRVKRNYVIVVAELCATILALTGCMTTPTPATAPSVLPSLAPTLPTATSSQGAKAALPGELDALESAAEDIMDDADSGDWVKAQQKVNAIQQNLTALGSSFQSAGVPSQLIDGIGAPLAELGKQVQAKNALQTKIQANQITKVIPDIYDYYQVKTPTDLGRLDYLGREVALNVQQGDWTTANSNMTQIKDVWAKFKPTLNTAAQRSAADFESSIDALSGDVGKQDATAVARTRRRSSTR
jgi:uncharacterized protein YpuA (DUF1002 family)